MNSGRRKQSTVGLLLWPMAAFYALLYLGGGDATRRPDFVWDWFMYTLMVFVALFPPCFLGYLMGRTHNEVGE
jgi:hypothetical protein